MKNIIYLVALSSLLISPIWGDIEVEDFSLVLEFIEAGSYITRESIILGMRDDATAGFDDGIDAFMPPPVGIGYHFVHDTTEPFNRLVTDYRNTGDMGTIWLVGKANFSTGVNVFWNDSSAIFDEDSATIYCKVVSIFDPIPERPFFDSTWSTLFDLDSISYNPTLDRLVLSVDHYTPVGVSERTLPEKLSVSAYPNPFNSAVRLEIAGTESRVKNVVIFDITGQRIADISNNASNAEEHLSSLHRFTWEPHNTLNSGVYLVRVKLDTGVSVDFKLTYIK